MNSWEKAYELFLSFYSKINRVLIISMKYNIFLYLSKIFVDNSADSELYNYYINQYKKIIFNYNDPTIDIFQLIPYIFGVDLDIIYYESTNDDELEMKIMSFGIKKDKSSFDKISIIYFFNYYFIGYQKKDYDNNKKILESVTRKLNEMPIIKYTKEDKIFCNECDKIVDCIELINENNRGICFQCLNKEIDDYLNKRINYIREDYKDGYIDYSFYLRPIDLILKEPLSIKDNIENDVITINNIDYYLLFEETFSQRISILYKKTSLKNSININNNIITDNGNDKEEGENICSICQRQENILASSCGCKFCEDCLYEIFSNITKNQMILNGYEKMKLLLNDSGRCPKCQKTLNMQYLTMLFEGMGKEFGNEYDEAKKRMQILCKTLCFICEKKLKDENNLEVPNKAKKKYNLYKLNVMINKHCIKKNKINEILNNDNGDDYEKENEIDYCDAPHIICTDCYKKNRVGKIKNISEIEYKVMQCNICGIQHYVSVKEWDRWNKNEVCCRCNIF